MLKHMSYRNGPHDWIYSLQNNYHLSWSFLSSQYTWTLSLHSFCCHSLQNDIRNAYIFHERVCLPWAQTAAYIPLVVVFVALMSQYCYLVDVSLLILWSLFLHFLSSLCFLNLEFRFFLFSDRGAIFDIRNHTPNLKCKNSPLLKLFTLRTLRRHESMIIFLTSI